MKDDKTRVNRGPRLPVQPTARPKGYDQREDRRSRKGRGKTRGGRPMLFPGRTGGR